LNGSP
jgi:myo-inositol-1-phosphate synthase